ncbi:uncharacterized protein EDB91DRAFT_1108710 [Suillus paluster]|uniref:uncharacterized protein n=1 Tax=Suillus paluster TaxID=48578 RepID=UPI001B8752E1|nr:uncharacterized protein EDB91DRAFT_1108710 [Suillus paluster]KAG1749614.1 hypothetical protein EDB91DRAFT_1108710 [Suillus paluster]
MSKGKGKEVEPTVLLPPMSNPSAGSANPSASLSSLWGYLLPALNHIVRSPSNSTEKAPVIDVSYHMGIHTATYNYFTMQVEAVSTNKERERLTPSGTDLYEHIDKYYAEVARELLLGAPEDDSSLIHYIVPCFNRYAAGAHSVNRLLNYVNRHYVKRAVDEDRGWLTLNDIFDAVAKAIQDGDTKEKIASKLKERRTEELKKWGWDEGGTSEQLAQAESCAEAASPLDRVIPLSALALRRFRTEFMEPLLAVPKLKGNRRKKPGARANGNASNLPKGRLARAVKELLEKQDVDVEERKRLVTELANALRVTGVRDGHPLRKKVEKYLMTGNV